MGARHVHPGWAGPAGQDRAAGRGRDRDERDRTTDWRVQADGDLEEEAVCRRGNRGLADRPEPGKPRTTDDVAIVLATLEPPPERLGVTHWSSRLLAAELGVSNVKIADVWREWGLQPWRAESFKFSTDRPWRPRSATSPGSTSIRRTRLWCCAWMKNPRRRRWNGPRRCCRCAPGSRKSAAMTTSGTAPPQHHHAVRRAGSRDRAGDRRLLSPAPARGVPEVSQASREGLTVVPCHSPVNELGSDSIAYGAEPPCAA